MQNLSHVKSISQGLLLMMMALPLSIMAKEFPGGCRPAGFSFQDYALVLTPRDPAPDQSIFFIHNKKLFPIKLFQLKDENLPYVMNLNNTIKANQWGAFASDEKIARFACTVPARGKAYGRIINCKEVLSVCEYTNVKFAPNNRGTYWAIGSRSKYGAVRNVIYQGTLLRW